MDASLLLEYEKKDGSVLPSSMYAFPSPAFKISKSDVSTIDLVCDPSRVDPADFCLFKEYTAGCSDVFELPSVKPKHSFDVHVGWATDDDSVCSFSRNSKIRPAIRKLVLRPVFDNAQSIRRVFFELTADSDGFFDLASVFTQLFPQEVSALSGMTEHGRFSFEYSAVHRFSFKNVLNWSRVYSFAYSWGVRVLYDDGSFVDDIINETTYTSVSGNGYGKYTAGSNTYTLEDSRKITVPMRSTRFKLQAKASVQPEGGSVLSSSVDNKVVVAGFRDMHT